MRPPVARSRDVGAHHARLLLQAATEVAVATTDAIGIVTGWSAGAARLSGRAADDVVGRPVGELLDFDGDRLLDQQLAAATSAPDGRAGVRASLAAAGGERRAVEVTTLALRDDDGRIAAYGWVLRPPLGDVLEREQRAAEQLRRVDALRNELLAVVAHDMRGPLAVIRGFAEVLAAEWDALSDHERRDLAGRMARRSAALCGFVSDVFDTARIELGQLELDLEELPLREVLDRVVADVRAGHPDHPVVVHVPDDLPPVRADRHRAWQILGNVVTNAAKFSPPGSPIEVSATADGAAVTVAVRDHGPGIEAEHLATVFDRFTRLPGSEGTPGSGMGLFIARSLTEAHGGTITVDSTPGQGSTFRITLPVA